MAFKGNPQVQDGFVKIANELYFAILAVKINLTELKIILVILKLTYGFGRKVFPIKLSEFENLTGIKRQNCWRSIQSLAEKNMITVIPGDYSELKSLGVIPTDYSQCRIYGINKKYLKWNVKWNCNPYGLQTVITSDYSCEVIPLLGNIKNKRGGSANPKKGKKPRKKPTRKFKPRHEWHFANPTLIPSDFKLSDDLKKWGMEKLTEQKLTRKINLDNFTNTFRLKCQAKDIKYRDWKAAWKQWLLKQIEWALEDMEKPNQGNFGVYQ